jgi:predicted component of type VI protein secretion system
MQRQEVKDRQAMHDALVRIGSTLQAVIKGLIGVI